MTNYTLSYLHAQIRETDVRDSYLTLTWLADEVRTHPIPLPIRRLIRRAR